MPNLWNRLTGAHDAPAEQKAIPLHSLVTWNELDPSWTRRGFVSLATEGFAKNPVVYRCVRLIAEAAARVPLRVSDGGKEATEHPLLALLARPNARQAGGELLEAMYAFLQTAGNAYLQAAVAEGEVRGLYVLRPDRVRVVAGADGWPTAYAYVAGGRTVTLTLDEPPLPRVVHLALFHPLDDHYGMSPMEAAAQSIDLHNAAAKWNKALLDNAARPSGCRRCCSGSPGTTRTRTSSRRTRRCGGRP
jgi:HK97 family phage portal protein